MAAGNKLIEKPAVLADRLGSLSDDVVVLFVRRHVDDLVRHDAGLLVDPPIRRLDEAVLVDPRVSGERGDKTDVLTFRRFHRAQPAVVGVVHVAHFHACPFAVQTAGAEGGELPLVSELGDGVLLVHELGELGAVEELLDLRRHRLDVDELLYLGFFRVGGVHLLDDLTLHVLEALAHLVLEKLAHRTHTPVGEVVDIVVHAHAVREVEVVVDDGDDVVLGDLTRDEGSQVVKDSLLLLRLGGESFPDRHQRGTIYELLDAELFGVPGEVGGKVHGVVADDLDALALTAYHVDRVDARVLDRPSVVVREHAALGEYFARFGDYDVLGKRLAHDAVGKRELLVVLISAHAGDIVALLVVEDTGDIRLDAFVGDDLAVLDGPVQLLPRVSALVGSVLGEGRLEDGVVPEDIEKSLVLGESDGAEHQGGGDLLLAVYLDVESAGGILLELHPSAVLGDDGALVCDVAVLIHFLGEVDARAPDELADDNALCAVDDEGPRLGHEGDITHEYLVLFDEVALLADGQAHFDAKRRVVGDEVVALTRSRGEVGLLHPVLAELENETLRSVRRPLHDGRELVKDLAKTFFQELLIRTLLQLDKIGEVEDLLGLGEAHSFHVSVMYLVNRH